MTKIYDYVVGGLSFIIGIISNVCGGWNKALTSLLIIVIVDYATGLLCSYKNLSNKTPHGGYSSNVGFKGIFKKVFIFLIIVISYRLEIVFNISGLKDMVTTFYIINECMSILENFSLMGWYIPVVFKKMLEVTFEEGNKNEGNITKN